MHTYASLEQLLLATVQKHINPTASIVSYVQLPSSTDVSKINVQHFNLRLNTGQSVILITKPSPLIERRVLSLLNDQKQTIVPLSHSLDLTDTGEALICLEDAGKPVLPHADEYQQKIAEGLAKIHAVNMGKEAELDWLPKTDRAYFVDFILGWTWRLAWERALEDPNFIKQFGSYIPKVQSSVKTFPDAMQTLFDDAKTRTLIHTDIYSGHVLANKNPYIEVELLNVISDSKNRIINSNSGKIKANVAITLNGKCRFDEITVSWHKNDENTIRFIGTKQLLMSDFGIQAPVAAMGLIKVHNEILIHFDLYIQAEPKVI